MQLTSNHSSYLVGQIQREWVAFKSFSKHQPSLSLQVSYFTPSSAGSGESTLTGQTFQQFMGLLWDALIDKYGEWLTMTYSKFPSDVCSLCSLLIMWFQPVRNSSV